MTNRLINSDRATIPAPAHRKRGLMLAAVLSATVLLAGVANADTTIRKRCQRSDYGYSCSTAVSEDGVSALPRLTAADIATIEAREKEWETACQPRLVTGDDGLPRYVYAHENCDIGHLK